MLCVQFCPTLCTPWTVAHQAPLEFSRQEYWSSISFSEGRRVETAIFNNITKKKTEGNNGIKFTSMLRDSEGKASAWWEKQVRSLGWEDSLEKEMATHSGTLAWKIPWMEKPGKLQSMRLQRVGHN